MKTPSLLVSDLLTSISNCYYCRKIHKKAVFQVPDNRNYYFFPMSPQPRSLHLVHLNKPDFTFSGLLGQWGLNGIFCIKVYSSLIMACNTYMYNLYYLLYAGIGFWSQNTLSKMEKSLMNSFYQHLLGVDPENSEKGGWDTFPLAS